MSNQTSRLGSALLIMLGALGVIIVMAAFAINVAYMQLVRTELRTASDAAARAGAEALARLDSVQSAKQAAIDVAADNLVGGQPLLLTDSDILIGHSDQVGSSGKWNFQENVQPYSSVRVNSSCLAQLMMVNVTGRQSFSPEMVSTAAFSENEICLVVDRSHSMCFDHTGVDFSYPVGTPAAPPDPVIYPPHATGSRWASLEAGVNTFLDSIATSNATQRVALVTWGSEITLSHYEGALTNRTFEPSTLDVALNTDTSLIRTAIANRTNDVMLGGTDMSAGIDMGVDVLTGTGTHNYASKILILMTDGKWNFGRNPNLAAIDAKKKNITIHTVTFLDKADQSDMQKVAKTTGGQHYHASNQSELVAAFQDMARNLPVVLID
ncbi:MAG: vWA domain-containing protein [Pirellulaceae bacterium]